MLKISFMLHKHKCCFLLSCYKYHKTPTVLAIKSIVPTYLINMRLLNHSNEFDQRPLKVRLGYQRKQCRGRGIWSEIREKKIKKYNNNFTNNYILRFLLKAYYFIKHILHVYTIITLIKCIKPFFFYFFIANTVD